MTTDHPTSTPADASSRPTEPAPEPADRTFVLTDGAHWRSLRAAASSTDALTDTELLHAVVLPEWRVLADQVSYHHTAEQAVRAARREGGLAVLLHAPRLEQVMAVARTGTKLPRKSTSFGPKPRTGLVMRRFADEHESAIPGVTTSGAEHV
jgi:hypothetical protein